MGNVYVTNLGGHDYSDAKRFGNLVFLTSQGFNPKDLDRVSFLLAEKLENFDPDQDYFLPVGQDLIILTAFYILAQRHSKFNVLFWDFRARRYVVQEYSGELLDRIFENLKLKKELMASEA